MTIEARSAVSPPPQADETGRASIDALRGAAALGVLLVHAYQLYFLRGVDVRWARSGDVGVSVFFVLSGYVIATSVLRSAHFSWRGFGRRRAARILPLYYLSLLVALVLIDPAPLLTTDGRADVIAHLFFLHGLAPGMRYSINGVLWTLSIEVAFYLLIALTAPLLRHRTGGWALGGGLVITGVAWRWFAFSADFERTAYLVQQLPGQADLFGVGILVALAVRRTELLTLLDRAAVRTALWLFAVSATAGALWAYHDRHPIYWFGQRFLVAWPLALAVAIGALVLAARSQRGRLHAAARWTGLASLGRISFGVYLFHAFAIDALGRAWFAQTPTVSFTAFVAVASAGSIVLSLVLHHTVEIPAMARGREAGPGHRSPTPRTDEAPSRPTVTMPPSRTGRGRRVET